jgi:undecaprenyl-diphosphatase
MSNLEVFILAFIEGLTEFIPVSSTGHLILATAALNIESTDFIKAFNVIIQFGAILAVFFLYWRQLKWNFDFYKNVTLAFIPTAIIGFFAKDVVDQLMDSTAVVGYALIIGGLVLIWIDNFFKNQPHKDLNAKSSLLIGIFQSLAMIPGVSRSAATIIGGQLFGLSRQKAAEFSFILAIPTLGAATTYKLWKIRHVLEASHVNELALGVFLSFIFSIFAIKFFVTFITRYGFKLFGFYRIILGTVVLFFNARGSI